MFAEPFLCVKLPLIIISVCTDSGSQSPIRLAATKTYAIAFKLQNSYMFNSAASDMVTISSPADS